MAGVDGHDREGASSTPSTSHASRGPLPVIANALRIAPPRPASLTRNGSWRTPSASTARILNRRAGLLHGPLQHPWNRPARPYASVASSPSPLAPGGEPEGDRQATGQPPLARLRGPRSSSATALELQMSERAQSQPRSILEAARKASHRPGPRAAARARFDQERNKSGSRDAPQVQGPGSFSRAARCLSNVYRSPRQSIAGRRLHVPRPRRILTVPGT